MKCSDSIQSGHYEGLPVRSGKLTATSPEHSDQSPLSRCSSTDVSHSPSHGMSVQPDLLNVGSGPDMHVFR